MNRSLLLIVMICMFGCSENRSSITYELSIKEQLADEILKKVATQVKQEKGLDPCGTGGQMMDQIKMLALSFDYRKPIDIEKGRELLITAVNEFVAAVNADERIRPYLNNYPFEPKNVEIRIFLQNPDGSNVAPGKLSVISALEGVLKYKMDDPETKLFKIVHTETFEEAVLKINGSKIEIKKDKPLRISGASFEKISTEKLAATKELRHLVAFDPGHAKWLLTGERN